MNRVILIALLAASVFAVDFTPKPNADYYATDSTTWIAGITSAQAPVESGWRFHDGWWNAGATCQANIAESATDDDAAADAAITAACGGDLQLGNKWQLFTYAPYSLASCYEEVKQWKADNASKSFTGFTTWWTCFEAGIAALNWKDNSPLFRNLFKFANAETQGTDSAEDGVGTVTGLSQCIKNICNFNSFTDNVQGNTGNLPQRDNDPWYRAYHLDIFTSMIGNTDCTGSKSSSASAGSAPKESIIKCLDSVQPKLMAADWAQAQCVRQCLDSDYGLFPRGSNHVDTTFWSNSVDGEVQLKKSSIIKSSLIACVKTAHEGFAKKYTFGRPKISSVVVPDTQVQPSTLTINADDQLLEQTERQEINESLYCLQYHQSCWQFRDWLRENYKNADQPNVGDLKNCLEKCLRWDYSTVTTRGGAANTFVTTPETHPEMQAYNKALWKCMDDFELAWNQYVRSVHNPSGANLLVFTGLLGLILAMFF